MTHLLTEFSDGILTLTLNRPRKLNALTYALYGELRAAIDGADSDENCHVVVLKGAGRAFSSGFDLNSEVEERPVDERVAMLHQVANRLRWAIWNCRVPVIAATHGYCLAGAFELVLPCDFVVSSEDCVFGEPEITFGVGPAFMMVPWMMNHRRAKEVLLTGRTISANEALDYGLVSRVVEAEQLDAEVAGLSELLSTLPPAAVQWNKRGINRSYEARGMKAHIDGWVETVSALAMVEDPTRTEFRDRVSRSGASAGAKWRDQKFNRTTNSD